MREWLKEILLSITRLFETVDSGCICHPADDDDSEYGDYGLIVKQEQERIDG